MTETRRSIWIGVCLGLLFAGTATGTEDLFRAVTAYWDADYDLAEELLVGIDRAALKQAEGALLLKFLGATRLAKGDGDGAQQAFSSLVELDPGYEISVEKFSPRVVEAFETARGSLAQRRWEEGMQSYNSGDFATAVRRFEQTLELEPRHPMAGEFIDLARDQADSSTAATPVEPTDPGEAVDASAAGQLLSALQPASYQIAPLEGGQRIYVDRDYVLVDVPAVFQGHSMIRTANDHKVLVGHAVAFELGSAATVFVAYDRRLSNPPGWLGGFAKTGPALRVIELGHEDDVTVYDVYRRDFPAGQVRLGANVTGRKKSKGKSMYFAFVEPH